MPEAIPEPKAQPQIVPKAGMIKRIFYHPNFNVVVGLFGIIGVLFGVFTYFASIEKPNLTYFISPTRTAIVQKGTLENFSVTYQGLAITNDLSSAEIQIWNQGKRPIRGGDITNGGNIEKTISIKTPHGEPIYTTTETNTRPEIGFKWVDNPNGEPGVKSFDWKILEQGDGIKLQIIYGGNVSLPIQIDGSIEGQKSLTLYDGKTPSQFRRICSIIWSVLYYVIILFFVFKSEILFKYGKTKKYYIAAGMILLTCLIVFGVFSEIFTRYLSKPIKLPF